MLKQHKIKNIISHKKIKPPLIYSKNIPQTPTELSGSFDGSSVSLSWKYNGFFDYFNIYRSFNAPINYVKIGASQSINFNDLAVILDEAYLYIVTSFLRGGESNNSTEFDISLGV